MSVFVIAECGSTWRFGDDHLSKAYRLIDAVKAGGADAAKFQWCSNAALLAKRRNAPELAQMYEKYLAYPREWLGNLKAMCDAAGVEFMCTTYIKPDIAVIAPLVDRFKVSSFEAEDTAFVRAHEPFSKLLIISCGMAAVAVSPNVTDLKYLHCITAYPCPPEQANLRAIQQDGYEGFSDHTTSTLTGAVAVGAGATILEKHVRLYDTPHDNPDYEHSLYADCVPENDREYGYECTH